MQNKLEYILENQFISEGYKIICGCDEAGRGPLAGPVYAAACILPIGLQIDNLNDSKKLSESKRDFLYDIIKEKAIACCVATASVEEIDCLNILNASQLAMRRAVDGLSVNPDLILVDGNTVRGFPVRALPIIKGDGISPNIAAASILAKVERDRYMEELDMYYPQYGFAKHKGYPTKEHMEALFTYGPCDVHRKTFLKFLDKQNEDKNII